MYTYTKFSLFIYMGLATFRIFYLPLLNKIMSITAVAGCKNCAYHISWSTLF